MKRQYTRLRQADCRLLLYPHRRLQGSAKTPVPAGDRFGGQLDSFRRRGSAAETWRERKKQSCPAVTGYSGFANALTMPPRCPTISRRSTSRPCSARQSPAREETDRQIFEAASGIGFMTVRGFPGAGLLTWREARRTAEDLQPSEMPRRRSCCAGTSIPRSRTTIAAGFRFSPRPSPTRRASTWGRTWRMPTPPMIPSDPLLERTPLPAEAALPGWRAAAAHYYAGDGEGRRCADGVDRPQPGPGGDDLRRLFPRRNLDAAGSSAIRCATRTPASTFPRLNTGSCTRARSG